jgi:hypothetical protein
MLNVIRRQERIRELEAMIEELEKEDNQFAGADETVYDKALQGLRGAIVYQKRMIANSDV